MILGASLILDTQLPVCENLLILSEKSLQSGLAGSLIVVVIVKSLSILKQIFHGYESGIFEDPLTIGDLYHLFEALLVDESESMV